MGAVDARPVTVLELQILVGEMPAIGCEHPVHGEDPARHADGNEQHVRVLHPCGCHDGYYVYCWEFCKYVLTINTLECDTCKKTFDRVDVFFVLGPVNAKVP